MAQREIVIRGIPLADVQVPHVCNTNNHTELDWTYGRILTSTEYREIISHSNRCHWRHLQRVDEEIIFTLSQSEISLILEASSSSIHTGRRPLTLLEELDELEKELPNIQGRYFCRLDQCSPKDSICGGKKPITSRKELLDVLITSIRCARACRDHLTMNDPAIGNPLNIYLLPWRDDWHQPNAIEYRVFCHRQALCYHSRVTAISQYQWPVNQGVGNSSEDCLKEVVKTIVMFCEERIIPFLSDKTGGNWVIDVMVTDNKKVELVEVNTFGAELAAGSALFAWIPDQSILYSNGDRVEFRYVS